MRTQEERAQRIKELRESREKGHSPYLRQKLEKGNGRGRQGTTSMRFKGVSPDLSPPSGAGTPPSLTDADLEACNPFGVNQPNTVSIFGVQYAACCYALYKRIAEFAREFEIPVRIIHDYEERHVLGFELRGSTAYRLQTAMWLWQALKERGIEPDSVYEVTDSSWHFGVGLSIDGAADGQSKPVRFDFSHLPPLEVA